MLNMGINTGTTNVFNMLYLSIYEHSKVMYHVTVWLITDYTYNGSSRCHTIMASLYRYLPGTYSHNVKSPI